MWHSLDKLVSLDKVHLSDSIPMFWLPIEYSIIGFYNPTQIIHILVHRIIYA